MYELLLAVAGRDLSGGLRELCLTPRRYGTLLLSTVGHSFWSPFRAAFILSKSSPHISVL